MVHVYHPHTPTLFSTTRYNLSMSVPTVVSPEIQMAHNPWGETDAEPGRTNFFEELEVQLTDALHRQWPQIESNVASTDNRVRGAA